MAVPGFGDIKGALMKGIEGTLFSSFGGFPIDTTVEDQMLPAVANNQQDRYMVVWQQRGFRWGQDRISFPVQGVDGGSVSMLVIQLG